MHNQQQTPRCDGQRIGIYWDLGSWIMDDILWYIISIHNHKSWYIDDHGDGSAVAMPFPSASSQPAIKPQHPGGVQWTALHAPWKLQNHFLSSTIDKRVWTWSMSNQFGLSVDMLHACNMQQRGGACQTQNLPWRRSCLQLQLFLGILVTSHQAKNLISKDFFHVDFYIIWHGHFTSCCIICRRIYRSQGSQGSNQQLHLHMSPIAPVSFPSGDSRSKRPELGGGWGWLGGWDIFTHTHTINICINVVCLVYV